MRLCDSSIVSLAPSIGFLHTAPAHVETFERLLLERAPGTRGRHVVEPALLALARELGPRDALVAAQVGDCLAQLADVAVIVCSCSTISGVAEASRSPAPVIRIDRPMARAAVRAGTTIALVTAVESAIEPARELLMEEAAAAAG